MVPYLAPQRQKSAIQLFPVGFNGPQIPLGIPPLTASSQRRHGPTKTHFSEDWMRPDDVPALDAGAPGPRPTRRDPRIAAQILRAPVPTDP